MVDKQFVTKVPEFSSEVIDLTTRKSGLDSFIEYDNMVRSLHKHGFDYTVEHHELARKFCKRGTV